MLLIDYGTCTNCYVLQRPHPHAAFKLIAQIPRYHTLDQVQEIYPQVVKCIYLRHGNYDSKMNNYEQKANVWVR